MTTTDIVYELTDIEANLLRLADAVRFQDPKLSEVFNKIRTLTTRAIEDAHDERADH
jgi:hypothetical protein